MPIQVPTRRSSTKSGPRTLSTAQLRCLLDFTANNPAMQDLHDVAVILTNTGLRAGELVRLRWHDVDFDRHKIAIVPHKSPCHRYVPVGTRTTEVLVARRERHPESEFVLGSSPEKLLTRIKHQLKRVCEEIGLGGVNLRVLRHTFIYRWVASGGNSGALMAICGWKSDYFINLHGEQGFEIAVRDQAQVEESQ